MTRLLMILAAILIIVAVLVIVAISSSVSSVDLTSSEKELISQACVDCHDKIVQSDDNLHSIHEGTSCVSCHENMHPVHTNAECQDCHAGTAGVETADSSILHLEWLGIIGAGILVLFMALNFFIVRRRLGVREE